MFTLNAEDLNKEYDVAIIGSGLGGLTAANILAKKMGRRVVLIEQHHKLGGLATWFRRFPNHIFDVSLHGFPYGMVKTCKRYWSKEIAESIVQLSHIRFVNPQFDLSTTFDRVDFTDKLINHFRIPKETIDEFFETARGMDFFHDDSMTTRELFEKFFPGRKDVVRLLMEPITYANGSTLDEPAITYGIVFSNFMSKGVFTFRGGTDVLVKKMKEELLASGVHIARRCKVDKIIVEGGEVKGLLAGGVRINCQAVLSNANILTTIKDMVGPEHFSEDFIEEVNSVRLNNSSCQVYMGIREGEELDDIGDLIFTSQEPEFIAQRLCAMDTKSRTFSLYYPKTRPGLNRSSIVSSTNANYKDWAELSEEDYQQAKKDLINVTLENIEKLMPGVSEKIEHLEVATPKTFERYTLHPQGTSFGTKFEGLKVSMDLNKKIRGLFHTGSVGIIMSGWLGAANYGVIQANNIENFMGALAEAS